MEWKVVYCCFLVIFLLGCSQPEKDKGIKQMVGTAAKEDLGFAGVNYMVHNGVVTLNGNCPSEKQKSEVEKTVKQIAGVKDVINRIVVAPVILTSDSPLQQSVDSVLMEYPTVVATVKDSVIALRGSLDSKKAQTLFTALQGLRAKALSNELEISTTAR